VSAGPALYLGLISGTSADGIDVALASFEPSPRLHAAATARYPAALRQRIVDLAQGDGRIALDELGALDIEIARAFAAAATQLLEQQRIGAANVAAIGSHGQTVRHRPGGATPYTLQLGDPNVIAEATGIATIADFRRRDMAAGGQGAPLAPAFHAAILGHDGVTRVVVNLGGIGNITVLPGDAGRPIVGFDTGPANCLLDAWASLHLGQPFDRDGAFAASGKVDAALLARCLADPYFRLPPPKSTGREVFHPAWLQQQLTGASTAPADVQATLLALTARTVADAIRGHAPEAREVLVCGGGVHNPVLMAALGAELPGLPVRSTATRGIDPDFVEAMLFAWLAHERLHGRPAADVARVTGARGARVLGAIYFGG
jgi:anhydro-N-acetylmuramic acid kinase